MLTIAFVITGCGDKEDKDKKVKTIRVWIIQVVMKTLTHIIADKSAIGIVNHSD